LKDNIFDENVNNTEIYEKTAKKNVYDSLKGYNSTIFVYGNILIHRLGQTGSGKTFTMEGDENNLGIMYLSIKDIFQYIEKEKDTNFILKASYLEIYKENIIDLLKEENSNLKIQDSEKGVQIKSNLELI
jgi:hypothetical protein